MPPGHTANPEETHLEQAPASQPDLALQAVWLLVESYRLGFGRTKLGVGSDVNPKTIRAVVTRWNEDQYPLAVKALRAWGRALANESAWLPEGGR